MAGKSRRASEWRALVNDLATAYERDTGSALPTELASRVAATKPRKQGRPKALGAAPQHIAAARVKLEEGLTNDQRAKALNMETRSFLRAAKKGAGEVDAFDAGALGLIRDEKTAANVERVKSRALASLQREPTTSDDFDDCRGEGDR